MNGQWKWRPSELGRVPRRRYALLSSVSFLRSRRSPLFFEIAMMSQMVELDIGGVPDLQVRCRAAFRVRLFAVMLTGYEAELHSQAGCARRRGGVPERCPAPQFPPSGHAARGDAVGY